MGEILRFRNLRICVFPKDHMPPHFHVLGPDSEAKFTIDTLECYFSRGFSQKALKEIARFMKNHKALVMEAWNENQG